MEIQQILTLNHLSTDELERKLGRLDFAYFLINDRQERQKMLLFIDEVKLELMKRGKI
jgi:hypothetical protein